MRAFWSETFHPPVCFYNYVASWIYSLINKVSGLQKLAPNVRVAAIQLIN